MKKMFLVMIVFLISATTIWAGPQAEITKYYAGTLTSSSYNVSNSDNSASADWRVGVAMKFSGSFGEINTTSAFNSSITIFSWDYTPNSWLHVGHAVRPTTALHRAHPVSDGGQFEPRSLGLIPAGAPYVKITGNRTAAAYQIGIWQYKNKFGEKMPEFDFGGSIGEKTKLIFSGYLNKEKHGSVATIQHGNNKAVVYTSSDSTVTNLVNFYFSKTGAIYSDFVWQKTEVTKYEIGATWDWTIETGKLPLNGLIGLGYVYQTYDPASPKNSLNLYFMAFIKK